MSYPEETETPTQTETQYNKPNRLLMEIYEFDASIAKWHSLPDVRKRFCERLAFIKNTEGYHTGDRLLECLTVQMDEPSDWFALFEEKMKLDPVVEEYAHACLRFDQDYAGTIPYAGGLYVSLLLQEDAIPHRPGVHIAIFIIYVSPHRQYRDGHIISYEFGEGSRTQQIIRRIFDVRTRAFVQEFTQAELLAFVADDSEASNLMFGVFLDDFNPMRIDDVDDTREITIQWIQRFPVTKAQNDDDDENDDINKRIELRRRHECRDVVNVVLHNGKEPDSEDEDEFAGWVVLE
jgi:hypothetical protein